MNTLNVKLNPHLYEYISENSEKFGLVDSNNSRRIYEILERAKIDSEERFEIDALIGALLNETEKQWFAIGWHCAKSPESMVIV